MKSLTPLQIQIIELLKKDNDFMTCDDIAWELKKHKMHIGNSVKALVKLKILDSYRSQGDKYSNIKYFFVG
jgi:predicted transcriptional regulator